ncbi:MAG: phosphoglycolate phosphatase [Paenirhodobacter sp.]|uniref:phosphoglycolate phosphatase n=1 Tax=Paenirhodobacter sp. TaxID=1965326 RepID=UPI003D0FA1B4
MPCSVIFDLDGTLIDSAPAIHAVSNMVLAEHGFAPPTLPEVRGFVGKGAPHLVRCLLENAGQDPDGPLFSEVLQDLVRHYETEVEGNRRYPGVRAALQELRDAGHPLAICTNKPYRPALAALRHVGLLELFDLVIGGDSLATRKPDPEMALHCKTKLERERAIFIGDSEIDAATAQNATLPFALYTEGYRRTPVHELPHSVAFSDFKMLPGLVANWHWG